MFIHTKLIARFFTGIFVCLSFHALAFNADNKFNLLIAPATVTSNSVTLLWDKQYGYNDIVYEILLNGKVVASTSKTNYTLTQLSPATTYIVAVRITQNSKELSTLTITTSAKEKIFNILDYGAKDDTLTLNTKAIQSAINACTKGGIVYIPKGIFISGALFLKSNMTLYIEKGATLKGSINPEDYLPMIFNRFEGWELNTYASLLNAGSLNRNAYTASNIRITGGGTILGGGKLLGNAMIKANGLRSRGRLICLMSCQNVCLSNLTLKDPPCWNIHYIYSNNITCNDLDIVNNVRNGDGLDPDSSTDSYIFNCSFNTGDDCIAIKSGKNPEGYFVAKPTKNVRISNCDFIRGHGISIGSEMSGGVSDVLVQDCKAGNLLNGMQLKGTKERGGYIKNVTVADCELLKITIFSAVNYNNDGEAAPEIPTFQNFEFRNIDMTKAHGDTVLIIVNGFKEAAHHLTFLQFTNISLPEKAKIEINDAEQIQFTNVKTATGLQPQYLIKNSTDINY